MKTNLIYLLAISVGITAAKDHPGDRALRGSSLSDDDSPQLSSITTTSISCGSSEDSNFFIFEL